MISNSIILDTFLFSSVFILIAIYNIITDLRKKRHQKLISVVILTIIFPILTTLLAVITFNRAPRLGVIIYLILFIIIISDFIYKKIRFKIPLKYSILIVIFEVLYIVLTPIIGFPVLYLSMSSPQMPNSTIMKVDTKVIQENFAKIKNKFVDIDELISNEVKNIDSIYSIIYNDIQEKNVALQSINNELYKTQKQLDLYKRLAKINEKEAQAIISMMESNKYIDYLIGLIIGIISSLIATYTIRILSKRNFSTIK